MALFIVYIIILVDAVKYLMARKGHMEKSMFDCCTEALNIRSDFMTSLAYEDHRAHWDII